MEDWKNNRCPICWEVLVEKPLFTSTYKVCPNKCGEKKERTPPPPPKTNPSSSYSNDRSPGCQCPDCRRGRGEIVDEAQAVKYKDPYFIYEVQINFSNDSTVRFYGMHPNLCAPYGGSFNVPAHTDKDFPEDE